MMQFQRAFAMLFPMVPKLAAMSFLGLGREARPRRRAQLSLIHLGKANAP